MKQFWKSCLVLTSLLLMSVPISSAYDIANYDSDKLTSPMIDGLWVNDTLIVDGTTTISPQTANWILYDITDPYSDWEVLRTGEYFSEVIPVEDSLWNWSITIDTQGLECTCWLEISQSNGMGKEFLNRIIFIGEGPHNPVLSPMHDSSIIVDEPVLLTASSIFSDNSTNESIIILSWCHAPNGACEGNSSSMSIDADIDYASHSKMVSFVIDANELGLYDGVWKFSYVLQDTFLRVSPHVEVNVYVDQTDPQANIIAAESANEGDSLIIDGSGSSDGVWGNNLQSIWYITEPDGTYRVASSTEINGMVLNLVPTLSGNYTVQLDVIDSVGRISSTEVSINIENVVPQINLSISESDVDSPNSWQLEEGETLDLTITSFETGNDEDSLSYEWYLEGKLVSIIPTYKVSDLEEGVHELRIVVTDDDGATDNHSMDLIVSAKSNDESRSLNHTVIGVLVGVLALGFVLYKRISQSGNEMSSMPKWETSGNKLDNDITNESSDENGLWDDSMTSNERTE